MSYLNSGCLLYNTGYTFIVNKLSIFEMTHDLIKYIHKFIKTEYSLIFNHAEEISMTGRCILSSILDKRNEYLCRC